MVWNNLDLQCADTAAKIAEEIKPKTPEKILTECAAVLSAHGPYAFALFLAARSKKLPIAEHILNLPVYMVAAERGKPLAEPRNKEQSLKFIKDLSVDLDDLLFAKTLIAQTLAYLKYEWKKKG